MTTEEHAKPRASEWCWMDYDARDRFGRMITHDVRLRSTRPIERTVELKHWMGYVSCARPDEHSGWDPIDIEAESERPIAIDSQAMARCAERRSSRRRRRWR